VVFICIFLINKELNIFHVFLGHLYVLFGKMFRSSTIFKIGWVFFFFLVLSCISSLYIFGINPFIRHIICRYFIQEVAFHFVDSSLHCAELCSLM